MEKRMQITWAGGHVSGLFSNESSVSKSILRRSQGMLDNRLDETSSLRKVSFEIPVKEEHVYKVPPENDLILEGSSTNRFFLTFKLRRDSMSPICDGRWVISLQLTSWKCINCVKLHFEIQCTHQFHEVFQFVNFFWEGHQFIVTGQ
jgi:hypothetical protein